MVTDTRPFDPEKLREKYRQERDKRLREDGNQQYVEVKGEFAHFVEDPYVEPGFERAPLTDDVDVVVIGGGFGGLLAGARLKEAGVDNVRHHREGRRLRRDVVLEPLSGRRLRRRVVRLSAAARGDRLHPGREVQPRAGDPGAQPRDRREVRALRQRLLPDRSHRAALGRRRAALDRLDEPRRPHARALRDDGERPVAPREAAGHPGHRELQGARVPHEPLGLRLHRRHVRGQSHGAARQARRHHRYRRDGGAVRAARRRGGEAALRLPAHTVID